MEDHDAEAEGSTEPSGTATIVISPDIDPASVGGTCELDVYSCQDLGDVGLNVKAQNDDNVGLSVQGPVDRAAVLVLGPGGESYAGAQPVAVEVTDAGVQFEGPNEQGSDFASMTPLGGTFSVDVRCELE